ncbi:squalene/phytoene synthase family protein [uncultured Corynebacterium sp.]|uniref:phytoene/squalene synthase family protein n=1 Tax=uncultured Corynebacterium sp. TaxID=159447 RepID=UPI0025ED4AE6|nr:squalene/phytoene synthase family protein [uncultured Corynebacterium sp.]
MADRVAADVIARYSTSFTLATRLLSPPVRRDVCNLYAVVRIADEIVDGAAAAAGEDGTGIRAHLDAYEDAVLAAAEPAAPGATAFHTDPVLHAFAGTARRCRLDTAHLRAFFASMRADLDPGVHDGASLAAYIHGSAEVIGLMCLDIFGTHGTVTADRAWLAEGAASLGSAFQKVNFLRDIGADTTVLRRHYLPTTADGTLTESAKTALLDECVAELDAGCERIPALPRGARVGVAAASALYRGLVDRLRETPAADLTGPDAVRVSVPAPRKALVTVRAAMKAILR